ncbi:MAG TPA: hypothetical protein DEQ80_03570 [Anaerolinea thermolimosa]|uniref:Glycosyltransferase RgtA/B/C/D-like domain-containing protein n=1 Tax=Anaerolinea thermolimosa TaxID=229919 RepID=A0A3D1JGP2_9CHLR|nr:hypothetical protein [Anaerolinea thermolimosa]GAP07360.1 hypothetical protein ATHL_02232 [Anaerolinea thermolimosa]HCE16918.1 hypothetical protein [Anaerolinea thermolimosa]
MVRDQKRNGFWVLFLGLVCFAALIFPNARGAQSEKMLLVTSLDEPVTYPHVVRMLTPARDFKDLFSRWIIYGDYHYGYPFYFFSALAVLPVRLIYGGQFTNYTAVNLLLLRQLVSVLPMLAAMIFWVYEQTRFRSLWQSVGLTIFMFIVPAIVRNHIQWWHPDALSVLSVTLVFVFLRRDDFRFGRNFLFAAVACGLAVGIKLAGVFFVLTIPYYLLAGMLQKKLTLRQAMGKALLFTGVALLALVVSNPFLYNAGARQELIRIQTEKTDVLGSGYEDDSPYYQKGPAFWNWTLSTWYGHPFFLTFLGLSLVAGCVWGPNRQLNRLILTYIIPQAVYLLWFVAVKPDHYWLPVMVPLFSTAFTFPQALAEGWFPRLSRWPLLQRVLWVVSVVILVAQGVSFLLRPYSGVVAQVQNGMRIEEMFSQTW